MMNRVGLTFLALLTIAGHLYPQRKDQAPNVASALFRHSSPMLFDFVTINELVLPDSGIPGESRTRAVPILKEAGYGAVIGVLCSLPGGLIAGGLSSGEGFGGYGFFVYGLYSGYVIGSSLGVYIVAKEEKPDVSFLGTLASGLVGSGIGIGIGSVSDHRGIGRVAPIMLPLALSIIYVELLE